MQVSEETSHTIRQTDIQLTTTKSIDVEPTAVAGIRRTAAHIESEVEGMEVDKPERAVREGNLPVGSAPTEPRALDSGSSIDPTILAEGHANETQSPVMQFTSAQQDLIDAVRETAEGIIPIGGATLEEDDRPDDVPRGLVFSEAEIRCGVSDLDVAHGLSMLHAY